MARSEFEQRAALESATERPSRGTGSRSIATGVPLGSVAGIAIRADWSLLIIFFLVTTMLGSGLFPVWHPEWSVAHSWLTALAAAVLFFSSVLAHELSHALVGRMHGVTIRRITLFVFGGMAELEQEPKQWRAELWMAIVGPLTSLVLGFGCLYLANALAGQIVIDPQNPMAAFAQLGTVATLLFWLGQVNVILAFFNLVPGFPLDGGRVLRALVWGATGNVRTATRWASGAGQAFAWLLIGVGITMILGARYPVLGGGAVSGIWLAFIGWFLNNAATMGYRQLIVRESLEDVPISRLMQTEFAVVSPGLPVSDLVDEHLLRRAQRAYPVLDDGRLVGLVTFEDVRKLDRDRWPVTRVLDIMTPADQLTVVKPEDNALEAMEVLGRRGVSQLPVVEGRELRGMLRREDVIKWLTLYGDGDWRSVRLV